jgi:hypothetical protein
MAKRGDLAQRRKAQRERLLAAYAAKPVGSHDAYRRREYQPIAAIAEIPPETLDAFIADLSHEVAEFEIETDLDGLRTGCKAAVGELITASARTIRAIEYVQKIAKQKGVEVEVNFWMMTSASLDSVKHDLASLQRSARDLSAAELPGRGEDRTAELIKNIWKLAKKHGGRLTYSDKSDSGTITEVIACLGVKRMKPRAIERLRPP